MRSYPARATRSALPLLVAGLTALTACEDTAAPVTSEPTALIPAEASLRRLTETQFRQSLNDLFGDGLAVARVPEPDTSASGFLSIGASQNSMSPRGTEQMEALSYSIAEQVLADPARRARFVDCQPAAVRDDACARTALSTLGRRAWRRPLATEEADRLVRLAGDASDALGSFDGGLEFAIAAILQSPNFLYRVEIAEPDPQNPRQSRHSSLEMASRLSYFLWNSTPDDELLRAGEAGELLTDEGITTQVARMLEDPRAYQGVRNFFNEYFTLYELDHLSKDPTVFEHASSSLGPSAREETLRTIEALLLEEEGDYRDLFVQPRTFLNRELASVYNVPAPARDGFAEYVYPPDSVRAGFLGQVSFLAPHSHAIASSATERGKFIRERLLCKTVQPPPVNANTMIPEVDANARTLRERLSKHASDPSCAGCHDLTDPIGLGFENFDAIGRFRTLDNGADIDPTGDLDGAAFDNPREFAARLVEHRDFGTCFVQSLFRYASGHQENYTELERIEAIARDFESGGYRLKPTLLAVALSPAFRLAALPKEGTP